jgi:anti-sigma B factor antagonist
MTSRRRRVPSEGRPSGASSAGRKPVSHGSLFSGARGPWRREASEGNDRLEARRRRRPASKEGGLLDIQIEPGKQYTVCRPVGELDAFTVSQFRQALSELASRPRLLIDMSGVPFVDSAGLGALIGGIRRARELGGDVAVSCSRPTLVRLLRTTGFDRIVTVAETETEAAEALLAASQEGAEADSTGGENEPAG